MLYDENKDVSFYSAYLIYYICVLQYRVTFIHLKCEIAREHLK